MAMSAGERARAAAFSANGSRRGIHHLTGTLMRLSPGALTVFLPDASVQTVRVGQRTLFRLAGRTVMRPDTLVPGRSVRVAYVQTEAGALAVMVELIATHRTVGARRSRLSISPSALNR